MHTIKDNQATNCVLFVYILAVKNTSNLEIVVFLWNYDES